MEKKTTVILDMTLVNNFDKKITVKKIIIPDVQKTLKIDATIEPGGRITRRLKIAENIPSYEWDTWSEHTIIVKYQIEGVPIELETSQDIESY